MATVYRCDRCFDHFPSYGDLVELTLPETSDLGEKSLEICQPCNNGLRAWATPAPERKKPEPPNVSLYVDGTK